ncbi:MAG TPA: hypothetical protein VLE70_08430 [Anaerolineae bacterium]|nr:hypothetical protein [Anaerolineae bacterium]
MSDRLAMPISSLLTIYWPFGRAQSLAAVPVRGGAVTVFQSLLGFIPLPLLFGLLAETIDLKRASTSRALC